MDTFIRQIDATAGDEMIVEGYLSSEAEDSHGTVFTRDATSAAMKEYVEKRGSVNVMHQYDGLPVGVVTDWRQDEGKTWFRVQLIDTNEGVSTWKAVKAGALRGFSIEFGGPYDKETRNGVTYYTRYTLIRVSLVDAPSNPDAVVTGFRSEKNLLQRLAAWLAGSRGDEDVSDNRALEALETRLAAAEKRTDEQATRAVKAETELAKARADLEAKTAELEAAQKRIDEADAEKFRALLVEAGYKGAELEKLVEKRAVFAEDPELLALYVPQTRKPKTEPRSIPVVEPPEGDEADADELLDRAYKAMKGGE